MKKKEKHSFGYWVKEFLRVGLLPTALVVGIWLGVYYFILKLTVTLDILKQLIYI